MDKATLDKEIKELEKKKEKLESEISQANMALNSTIDENLKASNLLASIKKQCEDHKLFIQSEIDKLDLLSKNTETEIANKKVEFDNYCNDIDKKLAAKKEELDEQANLNVIAKNENDRKLSELDKREAELDSKMWVYNDIVIKTEEDKLVLKKIQEEKQNIKDMQDANKIILKNIEEEKKLNATMLQKIENSKEEIAAKNVELEQSYNSNKSILEDISAAQDKLQSKEADLSQREAALLKDNKELDMQKQMLEEKEYNLTILDLNLREKQKKIVKQSKLYKLDT